MTAAVNEQDGKKRAEPCKWPNASDHSRTRSSRGMGCAPLSKTLGTLRAAAAFEISRDSGLLGSVVADSHCSSMMVRGVQFASLEPTNSIYE